MNERIKKLRKALNLTQQELADRIGSKRNTVATYEMGRTDPSAAVISLICREFNVNETWFRTGEGEMFAQQTRDEELAGMVERLMEGETASFKKRLISVLSTLKEDQWVFLEQKLKEILDEKPEPKTLEQEARAEAEQYYQEILREKRAATRSSALPDIKEA